MKPLLLLLPVTLAVAATTPIQPGKWQTTITILDVVMPGAPPGVAEAIKGRPTSVSACVTPAEAAAGPRAALEKSGSRCRYTSFSMTGGRIATAMTCQGGMTARAVGAYTPTSITMDGAMAGKAGLRIKTHTVSRRIGGC